MKRALLIAGGTVGSLGAVFAITPPQLSSTESSLGGGLTVGQVGATDVAPVATTTSAATASATPVATKTATSTKAATASKKTTSTSVKNSTSTQSASPSATATATQSATPTASATPAATAATSGKAQSGTFTGNISSVGPYGGVVIRITIASGKITDVQAVQAPGGRDQRYTDMAVPTMRQRTLSAQSANITGVSGASYTSYNFYKSLTSALSKAGWM